MPTSDTGREWWRSAVVYQVYPRSFQDSDGDGVGDIPGIIARLDYLHGLGVDVVWLSPVYRSPHDDNGYDISDYEDIDPMFGTLADVDELIAQLHARGMRLVMDLVVNHTSDEHEWFIDSRSARDSVHADWYMWRDPRPGTVGGEPGAEPNNWGSFFSGSVWEWEPRRGQYYLHLFSRKQPDLNWENPAVRDTVFAMMNRWLDRGVDGFRMDVINFISKDPALPDGAVLPTGLGDGMPYFANGPRLQEFLAEMKSAVFAARSGDYLTVGEMPDATPELAALLTDGANGQLSMIFQFEHVGLDHDGDKWNAGRLDIRDLKKSFGRWQSALADRGWNSLYWNNHDQPRIVSRWGSDRQHWYASATALATVLHLHRGTPYIYQGEELGMTNVPFDDISALRDIESLNHYAAAVNLLGHDPDTVLDALRTMSRDNARTPMQWSDGPGAGFTSGTPWIGVNPNHALVNAAAQVGDPRSIYAHYQRLIALRHADPVVVHGDFTMLLPDDPSVYAFTRELDGARLLVVANLSDEPTPCELLDDDLSAADLVLGNLPEGAASAVLAPWDARVYRLARR
ncbi:oligo-1,6-glucosidase [Microbacterium sp. cf046]|uniref:glycoside hydrolase family 13 protein n=1 Tax=Microbacterium sp. cf046 TaxID=1761803 RepID=UPI0008E9B61A|nr:alpha-glucosidase [Microbacterium sp. cf046]SFS14316.1 oligo-1,6-glucosidase [Microbacterium sp. cf046]